ncbi:MAG TPA: prepilin-type N-terminal cleavage/methylation domain-containing protein [Planctomycetota bacterium]|nr:prepilin-type N-terminal cleavage/methylation domain-containing protein [Planctomycetota bacterium]
MRIPSRGGLVLGEPRRSAKREGGRVEGFTLMELLVVIVILAILMSIAIGIVQGIVQRARTTRTEGLVKLLSTACEDYRLDYDVYPPGQDSRALHQALGSPRKVPVIREQERTIYATKGPLIEFRAGMLEKGAPSLQPPPPSAIVDAWDQEIHYLRPGMHRKKGVDIWSDGPKKDKKEDDITNWVEP